MSRRDLLRRLGDAALLAGMTLLALGLYYLVIKAGLPYQDPTPDMQLHYAVNQGIGAALAWLGAGLTALGVILRRLFRSKKAK